MSQPKRLLNLFTSLLTSKLPSDPSLSGSIEVDQVLRTLPPLDLVRLLKMIRDWNTNARTSPIAQSVLSVILHLRTAEDLVASFEKAKQVPDLLNEAIATDGNGELSSGGGVIEKKVKIETMPSFLELMDGLIPYSERHFGRLDKLVQESYMLDYIVGEMDGGVLGTEILDLS